LGGIFDEILIRFDKSGVPSNHEWTRNLRFFFLWKLLKLGFLIIHWVNLQKSWTKTSLETRCSQPICLGTKNLIRKLLFFVDFHSIQKAEFFKICIQKVVLDKNRQLHFLVDISFFFNHFYVKFSNNFLRSRSMNMGRNMP